MSARLLLTTTIAPAARIEGWAATDQMAYRLTRGQGPFTLYQHTHASALHLLAQNLSCASTVLENPTEDDLAEELSGGYELVGISFDPLNAERMLTMCDLIKRRSPRSKIVLGGYGAICMDALNGRYGLEDMVHGICRGEGVAFLRELVGDPPRSELQGLLPKEGASPPWLNPRPVGTNGVILSGLGCTHRCPFCVTSAAAAGRYVEVMDAERIFAAMRAYWSSSPFTASVSIYDENFLDHRSKVAELGRRIRADDSFGLARMNYSAFGSISALDRYDPEELLLSGVDKIWCGVESKFSTLGKRRGSSPEEVFSRLHAVGIKTIGSWIIGQEFQDESNIREDMDAFLALDPCFQQLSILGVVPGTPLWDQYAAQGRIPDDVPWSEYHLYGRTFRHEAFTHRQMLDHLDDLYDRIYRVKGPALMKALEVDLNGYETCIRSRRVELRRDKSRFFASQCHSYQPLIKTAHVFAPSRAVRSRVVDIARRYLDLFGRPSPAEQALADRIATRAQQHYSDERPPRSTEEPFRRYTYAAEAARPAGRPYRVQHPLPNTVNRRVRPWSPALPAPAPHLDP